MFCITTRREGAVRLNLGVAAMLAAIGTAIASGEIVTCPQKLHQLELFSSLFKIIAHGLSWMFVIGMADAFFVVIPIAAYQLFSVLFEKDSPEEKNPDLRPTTL